MTQGKSDLNCSELPHLTRMETLRKLLMEILADSRY